MLITTLPSFPKGENPFWFDLYHMGTYLGGSGNDTDVCIMFSQHEHNKYLIVVDTVTGQRLRIDLDRPEELPAWYYEMSEDSRRQYLIRHGMLPDTPYKGE